MNLGVFLKELDVLIMSPQWTHYDIFMNEFPSVGHNFGLKSVEGITVIGQTVKHVIAEDDSAVMFGSKSKSDRVEMDKIFVWNKGVLYNIENKSRLLKFMGDDKFVPSF